MHPYIEDQIRQSAEEYGIDPAFALAVAERESAGNPNAHASRTIHGLYQMSGPLRAQYGVGDSSDPREQADGWMRFMQATKQGLASRLGRDPTNEELYFAHHFGEGRAAAMIGGQAGGNTWVGDVFTPYERALNPHFDRAGTTGNLMSSIGADMDRRMSRFGGASNAYGGGPPQPIDFASYGIGAGNPSGGRKDNEEVPDFASYGVSFGHDRSSNAAETPNGGQMGAKRSPDDGQIAPGAEVHPEEWGVGGTT